MFFKKNIRILIITLTIIAFSNTTNAMEKKQPIEIETKKPPEDALINQNKIEKEIKEIEEYINKLEKENFYGNSTILVFSENIENIENLNKNILKIEQLEKEKTTNEMKEKITTLKNRINKFKEKLEKEINKKIAKRENIKKVLRENESSLPNKEENEIIKKDINQNIIDIETNLNKIEHMKLENISQKIVEDYIRKLKTNDSDLIKINFTTKDLNIKNKIEEIRNKINNLIEKLKNSNLINNNLKQEEEKEILETEKDIHEIEFMNIENISQKIVEDYIKKLEAHTYELIKISFIRKNSNIKNKIEEMRNKINNLIKGLKTLNLINDNLKQIEEEIPKIKKDINNLKNQNFDNIANNIENILRNLNNYELKLEKFEKEETIKQINYKTTILKNTISEIKKEITNQNKIFKKIKKIEQQDFKKTKPKEIEENINNLKKYEGTLKNKGYNLKEYLTNILIEQFEIYLNLLEKEDFKTLDVWTIEDYIKFLKNYIKYLQTLKEEIDNTNIKNKIDNVINNSKFKIPNFLLKLLKCYIPLLEQKNYVKLSSRVINIYLAKIKITKSDLIYIEKETLNDDVKIEITNLKNRIEKLEKNLEIQDEINIDLNEIEKIEQKDLNKLENKEIKESIKILKNYLFSLIKTEKELTNGKEEKEILEKINQIKNKIYRLELSLNEKHITNLENEYKNSTNQQNQIKDLNDYKANLVEISSNSTETDTKNRFNILIKKIENLKNERIEIFLNDFIKNLNDIKQQDYDDKDTAMIFSNNILNIENLNKYKLKLEEFEKEEISKQLRLKVNNLKNNLSKTILKLENQLNNKIDEKDNLNLDIEQNLNNIKKYISSLEPKTFKYLDVDELKKINDKLNQDKIYLNNLNQIKINKVTKSNVTLLQNQINILINHVINELTIKFNNIINEIKNKNFNNKIDIQNKKNILKGCKIDLREFKYTPNKKTFNKITNLIKQISKIENKLDLKTQQIQKAINKEEGLKLINSLEEQFKTFNNKYDNITSHIKDLNNIINNIYEIKNNNLKLIDENTLKGTIITSNFDFIYQDLTKILDLIKELSNKIYENNEIPLKERQIYVKRYKEYEDKTKNLKSEIENTKNFYYEALKLKKNKK